MFIRNRFAKAFTLVLVLISLILTGCAEGNKGPNPPQAEEPENKVETFTDMAGRQITLPEKIEKVFSLDPVGSVMLYTLSPDKIAGWNYEFSDNEKHYLLPEYHELPNLGAIGRNLNYEEILKVNPDVLLYVVIINEKNIAEIDKLQEELNIPVIMLDGEIENMPTTYEMLGKIIGEEERSNKLASYIKETLEDVNEKVKLIPEDQKVKVYYAEGKDGLETDPKGSQHVEILDMVGGTNVAEVSSMEGSGRLTVSMEQLLIWNPDLIISWGDDRGGYYSKIFSDEAWGKLTAVKEKEVYEIPNFPFNWFDRPKSANRIIGLKWLSNLLYPDIFE